MTSRGLSAAAVRNRRHYLRLLRETAQEAVSEGVTFAAEKGVFRTVSRLRPHEASLQLPANWVRTSTARLQTSLAGVVPRERWASNDLFLCALIHPSYVAARSVRAAVAMPIELTLTGSSALRLLREVAAVHGVAGVLAAAEVANIPRRLDVEDLLLYDASVFEACGQFPPEEVRMAAATALCGAVVLSEGIGAATALLDRLRGAENKEGVVERGVKGGEATTPATRKGTTMPVDVSP
ncbi:uncharacterized protein Tco025E_04341 [Trypanosoma conorhini]|uniref:Uncharacterized protein n=1 Tax=Trypanosoma conorhini TaxID=83891 RepID=A0A422PML5_9TRYP|nr:uncharacterized protein Tco025E_04341 [Trypanosoma conorhini]RNF18950.1 hypothetical protein Tco025E_04341 [Trypanosoma conorhini]